MGGVLNLKDGYVFIHVPKCAGFSISRKLLESEHSKRFPEIPKLADVMALENSASSEIVTSVAHARARDIRCLVGKQTYNHLESFTVVRNPWDRFKSLYHYVRSPRVISEGTNPYTNQALGSFSDFVLWICEERPTTMHDRLTDRKGEVIVKNILRFETLTEDLNVLAEKIPILGYGIPKLNAADHRLKSETGAVRYTTEAISAVQRALKLDFSLFEYPNYPNEELL